MFSEFMYDKTPVQLVGTSKLLAVVKQTTVTVSCRLLGSAQSLSIISVDE